MRQVVIPREYASEIAQCNATNITTRIVSSRNQNLSHFIEWHAGIESGVTPNSKKRCQIGGSSQTTCTVVHFPRNIIISLSSALSTSGTSRVNSSFTIFPKPVWQKKNDKRNTFKSKENFSLGGADETEKIACLDISQ